MGAIAVSSDDEKRIRRLAKQLGMASKAAVVRLAVDELERRVSREAMRQAIRGYVARYGALDREENLQLIAAGVAREEP